MRGWKDGWVWPEDSERVAVVTDRECRDDPVGSVVERLWKKQFIAYGASHGLTPPLRNHIRSLLCKCEMLFLSIITI